MIDETYVELYRDLCGTSGPAANMEFSQIVKAEHPELNDDDVHNLLIDVMIEARK